MDNEHTFVHILQFDYNGEGRKGGREGKRGESSEVEGNTLILKKFRINVSSMRWAHWSWRGPRGDRNINKGVLICFYYSVYIQCDLSKIQTLKSILWIPKWYGHTWIVDQQPIRWLNKTVSGPLHVCHQSRFSKNIYVYRILNSTKKF